MRPINDAARALSLVLWGMKMDPDATVMGNQLASALDRAGYALVKKHELAPQAGW